MFHVVLYQPEIPPNTGNIIRLCANTGCRLHLVHPLGFQIDEKNLKRAGLDYHDMCPIHEYPDWPALLAELPPCHDRPFYALSSKARIHYTVPAYEKNSVFVFGPETRGLPPAVLSEFAEDHRLTIPMQSHSRSLNLANSVAVVIYEAWRQLDFRPDSGAVDGA